MITEERKCCQIVVCLFWGIWCSVTLAQMITFVYNNNFCRTCSRLLVAVNLVMAMNLVFVIKMLMYAMYTSSEFYPSKFIQ